MSRGRARFMEQWKVLHFSLGWGVGQLGGCFQHPRPGSPARKCGEQPPPGKAKGGCSVSSAKNLLQEYSGSAHPWQISGHIQNT